jgi:integrase
MKIKLPYLASYRSRGRRFYYVRRKGLPNVRLEGTPGTQEFMRSYESALASPPARACRHGAGTFGNLVMDFYASAEFDNLKPSSQKTYRHVLDEIATKHGHRPAATLPADKATKMIEDIGRDRPGLANLVQSVMHRLMKFAIKRKIRSDNPFAGITPYKLGTHHTWTDAELRAFEEKWLLGSRQRLAYALYLYTGQRGGDIAKMRRQDIVDGCINVVQQKTGVALSIPIHAKLHEALKAGPIQGMHLIGDQYGRPISRHALTDMMMRAAKAAGLGLECKPHGLRKAVLRRLAEAGGTAKEIASVSGHKSLTEIERYTAAADQRRLSRAAMRKLSDETGTEVSNTDGKSV